VSSNLTLSASCAQKEWRGAIVKQRAAFTAAHVQDKILAAGVLDDMNDQASDILLVVADTGLRLSEACNLTDSTIHLDAPVPFVQVRADGRKTKTEHSARDIPLVGVALEALTRHPNGFPRYCDRAAAFRRWSTRCCATARCCRRPSTASICCATRSRIALPPSWLPRRS
jgi:integrase